MLKKPNEPTNSSKTPPIFYAKHYKNLPFLSQQEKKQKQKTKP